jgi:hypothetical protein
MFLLTTLLVVLASPVQATFVDGLQLRTYCQGEDRADRAMTPDELVQAEQNRFECFGYIEGVVDDYESSTAVSNLTPIMCMPADMRLGQAKIVVRRYLENHPELLHLPACSVIRAALKEAFPCKTR